VSLVVAWPSPRAARLWGHTSLALHVRAINTPAIALYASEGYRPVEAGGLRFLPGRLKEVRGDAWHGKLPSRCAAGRESSLRFGTM
jgi:hypothetical protein